MKIGTLVFWRQRFFQSERPPYASGQMLARDPNRGLLSTEVEPSSWPLSHNRSLLADQ